jgi:hypothetical protein
MFGKTALIEFKQGEALRPTVGFPNVTKAIDQNISGAI